MSPQQCYCTTTAKRLTAGRSTLGECAWRRVVESDGLFGGFWGISRVRSMISWFSNSHSQWTVGGMRAACYGEFAMLYATLTDKGICP